MNWMTLLEGFFEGLKATALIVIMVTAIQILNELRKGGRI